MRLAVTEELPERINLTVQITYHCNGRQPEVVVKLYCQAMAQTSRPTPKQCCCKVCKGGLGRRETGS